MWPGQASPRAAGSCRQLCWQETPQPPRAGPCPLPTAQVGKLRHGPARWPWVCEELRPSWGSGSPLVATVLPGEAAVPWSFPMYPRE